MRRRRKRADAGGSLDSFLDVVTNSLGLLILIACLNSGTGGGMSVDLGIPLMRDPDRALERTVFHCAHGQVLPVDEGLIESAGTSLAGPRPRSRWHEAVAEGAAVRMVPLEGAGDDLSGLARGEGDFAERLSELDPSRHWLLFATDQESFEAMRAARGVALERGFQVGWWPLDPEAGLSFAPNGIRPGRD